MFNVFLKLAPVIQNEGDAHLIFSELGEYSGPKYVYDNWYDVWSGAGLTWYKFDIWHQYFSGSGVFYHEQGFDEFWRPAGSAMVSSSTSAIETAARRMAA